MQVGRRGLLAIPGYLSGEAKTVIQELKNRPKSLKTIEKINVRQL
jgi:t-SNARE complex subunit (syntaxin)